MQRDAEVSAEDEQLFLMKLQTQLSKAPAGQRVSTNWKYVNAFVVIISKYALSSKCQTS